MSNFIPDLRRKPDAAAIWKNNEPDVEQAREVLAGEMVPPCAAKRWGWMLDNERTLPPSEVFMQTDGALGFLDGRTRAICRKARGVPVPAIFYTESEVQEWRLQRKSS